MRRQHEHYQRSVVVEATAKVEAAEAAIFVGLGQRMQMVLTGDTVRDLRKIATYLTQVASAIADAQRILVPGLLRRSCFSAVIGKGLLHR